MSRLTAARVKNLKEPGRYTDGRGLMLYVSPSGTKSWILRIQHDGRRRDFGLGSVHDVSLAEARDEAARMRKLVKSGLDPAVERRKAAGRATTFKTAALSFYDVQKSTWKNPKHREQWISTMEAYVFPKLGRLSPAEVDGPLIIETLEPIWLEIPETARRLKQRIGVVLDYAYARGWRETEAPLRSVTKGLPTQSKKRRRFKAMPYLDIPAFVCQIRSHQSVGRLALELLILTACRSGEIRLAVWDEFDLENGLWTIPAERMKTEKTHAIPLNSIVLNVLNNAADFRSNHTDLVFPGARPGKPMSDMTLLKILRDMDLPYTVHGFRSSFRDWAAEQSNIPGEVAEAALAHSIPNRVEAAYRRTDFLEKRRQLLESWAAFCDGNQCCQLLGVQSALCAMQLAEIFA